MPRRTRGFRRARHDARRRGRRGVRQGRPPARARLPGRRRARPARARRAIPRRIDFPVARVPGLDFSFSGVKTALLYAVRDLAADELERAPRRPRRVATSARSSARSSSARSEAAERIGAERIAVVGGVAANSELRASLPQARARAARALHRQRGDDRLGRPLRGADPAARLSCARCVCVGVAEPRPLVVAGAGRGGARASAVGVGERAGALARLARPRRLARARRRRPARPSTVGQRVLVVLRAPSLADRVDDAGGVATDADGAALDAARRSRPSSSSSRELERAGRPIAGPSSASRASLNGFSAPLDARAIALLERAPGGGRRLPGARRLPGVGVVRAARRRSASRAGEQPPVAAAARLRRPRRDDRAARHRRRPRASRTCAGASCPGSTSSAATADDAGRRRSPGEPGAARAARDRDGGLLVGAGGPAGLRGRRAGRDASCRSASRAGSRTPTGGWAVYARTDQLIAGLERAVDPNGDGDAHDAARIALVGVVEPFARVRRRPGGARRRRARSRLDTLVVAPAGNDGPAGPGFGSVGGPGGAPAALTVGRGRPARGRRAGAAWSCAPASNVVLDRRVPLARRGRLDAVAGRSSSRRRGTAPVRPSTDFFDGRGLQPRRGSRGARPGGADPDARERGRRARGRGRGPRLRRRSCRPARSALDEAVDVPVVERAPRAAQVALARIAQGRHADDLDRRPRSVVRNGDDGAIAPFSSRGLAFDGRVKPDVVAPGVGLATSEPGARRGRHAALRHRQRLERRRRRRRRRGRAARPGPARRSTRDRRSRACSSARRARSATTSRHRAGRGPRRPRRGSGGRDRRRPRHARLRPRAGRRLARARRTITVRNVSTRRLLVSRSRRDGERRPRDRVRAAPAYG